MVVWAIIGAVNLRANKRTDLHHDIVRRGGDGSLFHVEAVFADPACHDGVEVGVSRDQGDERETAPFASAVGQGHQGDEAGHDPELADKGVQGPLVEVVAAVRQAQHGDDLEDGGRDRQDVGIKGRVSETLEREGQVGLHGCRGDVGHQPDEVETPHGLVFPCLADVFPGGGLLDGGEALGGVIAEDALF